MMVSERRHIKAVILAVVATVVALTLLSPGVAAQGVKGVRAIRFQSFEQATRLAEVNERVTVVYFTADWCGWCRKMQSTTFPDAAVVALASRFNWAKVDIDEAPALAARFGVQAVPAVVLLSSSGRRLDGRVGFLSPADISAWLIAVAADPAAFDQSPPESPESPDSPDSPVVLAEIGSGKAAEAAAIEIIRTIANSDRADQDRARAHILAAASRAWPGLVTCLADRRLAVRAAAYDLLSAATDSGPAFDPFAPAAQRSQQAQAWSRWLSRNAASQPQP